MVSFVSQFLIFSEASAQFDPATALTTMDLPYANASIDEARNYIEPLAKFRV
jgi:hypothetical protein